MNRVFLLLGTNLGDKRANLETAIAHIEQFSEIIRISSLYQTDAWGKTDQEEFLNQVVEIATPLAPEALLDRLLEIETTMGRKRLERWGTRLIDVDLLLYGSTIVSTAKLNVPHPQMQYRRFTLEPLAEIAADVVHPVLQKTIQRLLDECVDTLDVTKLTT